jgi:hypothetical protein
MRMPKKSFVAVLFVVAACNRAGSAEDQAFALVQSQAGRDLGCSDVVIKKMGQAEDAFEYQARCGEDVYSYAITCNGTCTVTAGVRGVGLAGEWSRASSVVDSVVGVIKTGADIIQQDLERERAKRQEQR